MQTPNPGASLSDVASQVTTNTVLRYRGAIMRKAEPFGPCPGEAGLQTFTVSGKPPQVLYVAFTQWNGTEKIASYERPAKASDDPAAIAQLRRVVCSS